jgi:hypothetical protein
MVADFVGDYVGLCELAALASGLAATEPLLQILKECRVKVDLLIQRAVPIQRIRRSPSA